MAHFSSPSFFLDRVTRVGLLAHVRGRGSFYGVGNARFVVSEFVVDVDLLEILDAASFLPRREFLATTPILDAAVVGVKREFLTKTLFAMLSSCVSWIKHCEVVAFIDHVAPSVLPTTSHDEGYFVRTLRLTIHFVAMEFLMVHLLLKF